VKHYEYRITAHPAEEFREVVVFCSEEAVCSLSDVPKNQLATLTGILNEEGAHGWELVNIAFGREGILAFWKRQRLH
jgi:hypothetical protein